MNECTHIKDPPPVANETRVGTELGQKLASVVSQGTPPPHLQRPCRPSSPFQSNSFQTSWGRRIYKV